MTLSQIIAKDSYYDQDIPVKGHFRIEIEIHDGTITLVRKEEKIKKEP